MGGFSHDIGDGNGVAGLGEWMVSGWGVVSHGGRKGCGVARVTEEKSNLLF